MMAVGNEIINSGPDIFIFPANAFLFLHFLNKKDDATQKKKNMANLASTSFQLFFFVLF